MPPVKQSSSKEDFLKAIALDVSKSEDKQKFSLLWQEVTTYWCHHFETDARNILKPEYGANPAVHRPYKWAHIAPATIDNAIADIWRSAGPYPRMVYDMGASEDRRVYNWVLKWLLWHVCRYRDWRNRKGRSNGTAASKAVTKTDASKGIAADMTAGVQAGTNGVNSADGGSGGGEYAAAAATTSNLTTCTTMTSGAYPAATAVTATRAYHRQRSYRRTTFGQPY